MLLLIFRIATSLCYNGCCKAAPKIKININLYLIRLDQQFWEFLINENLTWLGHVINKNTINPTVSAVLLFHDFVTFVIS